MNQNSKENRLAIFVVFRLFILTSCCAPSCLFWMRCLACHERIFSPCSFFPGQLHQLLIMPSSVVHRRRIARLLNSICNTQAVVSDLFFALRFSGASVNPLSFTSGSEITSLPSASVLSSSSCHHHSLICHPLAYLLSCRICSLAFLPASIPLS